MKKLLPFSLALLLFCTGRAQDDSISLWQPDPLGHYVFIQFTGGSHRIPERYRTSFDTATRTDLSRLKTVWSLKAGYYFADWLGVGGLLAFSYSGKQKNIDSVRWGNSGGITVNGSGNAAAMVRFGLVTRLQPYRTRGLLIYVDIDGGGVRAIAGGGKAQRTIGGGGGGSTTIVKRKQTNLFVSLAPGLLLRLGRIVYLTGNWQYTFSKLKEPFGSVNALTGHGINVGLGFSIPPKKTI
jgi:hypothetical protein